MADITAVIPRGLKSIEKAWLANVLLLLLVAIFDNTQFWPTVSFAAYALWGTLLFIAFAVFAVAYLKATGAETLLAKAFQGNQVRMVVLAALLGGLSPFCSCEVIPFIAAMLALGAPLGAVMAFWLASPLMDPAMFLITSGTLGWEFAIAKTIAAISLGIFGGTVTTVLARSALFTDPLRKQPKIGGCCGVKKPFEGAPVWRFWQDGQRLQTFQASAVENGLFLLKWLTLAYIIEALMVQYIPAEMVASMLGGEGIWPIMLGALVGAPAYLNGYAAVPLIDALLTQGMSDGAAMSFVIAGGVSSIPAAIAVWALVKPRIFFAYLGLAMVGAVIAGLGWGMIA